MFDKLNKPPPLPNKSHFPQTCLKLIVSRRGGGGVNRGFTVFEILNDPVTVSFELFCWGTWNSNLGKAIISSIDHVIKKH